MAEVEVKGFAEFEALLKKLPNEMFAQRIVTNGLKAGGRLLVTDMKARAPVLTGALRDSIVVTSSKKATKDKGQAIIGFKKPTSRRVHLTEFGTKHSKAEPFIRPAIDTKGTEAIQVIGENMGKGIERVARKLYGK